ncbi:MAG: UbiA family prenyltransferase [Phycisphaerae bacterium]|nr:UbiA family prenyltransferase [Phycisphaerae bacterium]
MSDNSPTIAASSPADQSLLPILCVDLDGTLIQSDLLIESFVAMVRNRPLKAIQSPWCLLRRGRAGLKQFVAEFGPVDVARLPYRQPILERLRAEWAAGRTIVLATAANESLARAVAAHLNLFDAVVCSDSVRNLKGHAKLQALQTYCGGGAFDYVGNARDDLAVWAGCHTPYVVSASRSIASQARGINGTPAVVWLERPNPSRKIIRVLRPQQWIKNALVLVPMMTSHQLNARHFVAALLAVAAFCLAASSIYVVNDALDVHDDRLHPTKRKRPFANGDLPLPWAPALAAILLGACCFLCLFLPWHFAAVLLVYYATSTAYSFWLKSRLLVDVVVLAGLYTLRIFAGGAAVSVEVSPWLMAFSIFLFLSLAFAKRYVELANLPLRNPGRGGVRGYVVEDLRIVGVVGPCTGCIAALVLALYVNSGIVTQLYRRPPLLWLLLPLQLYWITRIWFFAERGALHDDPVMFAVRDRVTWLVLTAMGIIVLLATL